MLVVLLGELLTFDVNFQVPITTPTKWTFNTSPFVLRISEELLLGVFLCRVGRSEFLFALSGGRDVEFLKGHSHSLQILRVLDAIDEISAVDLGKIRKWIVGGVDGTRTEINISPYMAPLFNFELKTCLSPCLDSGSVDHILSHECAPQHSS